METLLSHCKVVNNMHSHDPTYYQFVINIRNITIQDRYTGEVIPIQKIREYLYGGLRDILKDMKRLTKTSKPYESSNDLAKRWNDEYRTIENKTKNLEAIIETTDGELIKADVLSRTDEDMRGSKAINRGDIPSAFFLKYNINNQEYFLVVRVVYGDIWESFKQKYGRIKRVDKRTLTEGIPLTKINSEKYYGIYDGIQATIALLKRPDLKLLPPTSVIYYNPEEKLPDNQRGILVTVRPFLPLARDLAPTDKMEQLLGIFVKYLFVPLDLELKQLGFCCDRIVITDLEGLFVINPNLELNKIKRILQKGGKFYQASELVLNQNLEKFYKDTIRKIDRFYLLFAERINKNISLYELRELAQNYNQHFLEQCNINKFLQR